LRDLRGVRRRAGAVDLALVVDAGQQARGEIVGEGEVLADGVGAARGGLRGQLVELVVGVAVGGPDRSLWPVNRRPV
jgi:hypothetical protein